MKIYNCLYILGIKNSANPVNEYTNRLLQHTVISEHQKEKKKLFIPTNYIDNDISIQRENINSS